MFNCQISDTDYINYTKMTVTFAVVAFALLLSEVLC